MRAFTDKPRWHAPVHAEISPVGLPAYVAVCDFDRLRGKGLRYTRRLLQASIQTELHYFPETFHGSRKPDSGCQTRQAEAA
ncbi:alpha/beta hydrolase fold domain-containing protein [Streptomyces sp. QTS52]